MNCDVIAIMLLNIGNILKFFEKVSKFERRN